MGLTHFPNGVASFGMPMMGIGEETMTTGNVFFVDSGGTNASDGNLGTAPDKPMATIDATMARCTANNGDIIFVMPGHDENPIVDIAMDVAGVWVRGLGWGGNKPTVTFGALGAAVVMSAASCRISNIRFDLGTVATTITNAIAMSAADCIIERVESVSHATSQFTNIIALDASATRGIVRGCYLSSLITAGASSGIYLDGCDDIQLVGNVVMGHFGAAACIDNTTGSDQALQALITHNWLHNDSSTAGDLTIHMDDDATGILAYNNLSGGLALAANYNFGAMRCIENYVTDALDVFALIAPTTTAA